MNKKDQLDALFKEWEHTMPEHLGKFAKDGIINEQEYEKVNPKILFITKEMNNPGQKEFSFDRWWNSGEIHFTFSNRIAEWAYGLFNSNENGFPEFDKITPSDKIEALKKIAFMNIKKTGGGPVSNKKSMIEYAKENLEFIQKEIKIIQPDIIILGLSWWELRHLVFPGVSGNWKWSNGKHVIGKDGNCTIIDFYHPSAIISASRMYYLLNDIVISDKFRDL